MESETLRIPSEFCLRNSNPVFKVLRLEELGMGLKVCTLSLKNMQQVSITNYTRKKTEFSLT